MIKLTEVVAAGGEYNVELQKNMCSYKLRDIFINPSYVVSMRDDEIYNNLAQKEGLLSGLVKEAKFTKLSINMGGTAVFKCTVAGEPGHRMEKFSKIRGK